MKIFSTQSKQNHVQTSEDGCDATNAFMTVGNIEGLTWIMAEIIVPTHVHLV